ncbi:MAG: GNAT family N-acetyltransferase [Bacteroidetes bacterium]|nr:GNAT family N-acetyltransferase [Bacteroidota bacterium]
MSHSFQLRPLQDKDAPSISKHANNRKIWLGVRDHFPFPYTVEDAEAFIQMAREEEEAIVKAIVVEGEVVGAIGIHPQEDVNRICVEVGYWVSEKYWGNGIATAAVREMTKLAFELGYTRVFATVFGNNPASGRVLEKAGFTYEGTMKASAIKDGKILDMLMYGIVCD